MPGLLRGIARTALVAGTATAVSNRVTRRQAGRWARRDQQESYVQQDVREAPPAPPPTPPPSSMDDKLAQLKQLGELRAQGVLSDAEFEQQKSRILNT